MAAVLALAGLSAAQGNSATPSKTLDHPYSAEDYTKPKSHIWNIIAPYTAREITPPNFANSPRIDQVIRDGKIYLSMSDAITLALENNLDLAIARYNLSIADTDILRTKAGASARGVNTGVVSGTPGGTGGKISSGSSGGGSGGTSTGAGGAGTGSGGIVVSTLGGGPSTPSFDPFLSGTLGLEQAITPQSNTIVTGGARTLSTHSTIGNFSVTTRGSRLAPISRLASTTTGQQHQSRHRGQSRA